MTNKLIEAADEMAKLLSGGSEQNSPVVRNALTAYRSARNEQGEAEVKPLVWEYEADFHCEEVFKSDCFFGTYWSYNPIENMAGFYFEIDEIATVVSTGPYDTMDAAKAAAQADYETRIRSALAGGV